MSSQELKKNTLNKDIPLKNISILFLTITPVIALITPFLDLKPVIALFLILIAYFTIIFIFKPKIGLYLFLLLRPCLDLLSIEKILNFGGFSLNFASLLAIITLFIAILHIFLNYKKLDGLPLKKSWVIFLGITFLSILISTNPNVSLVEWVRLLSIFALFILGFIVIETKKDLTDLVKIIILSALIPGVFALFQYLTNTGINLPFEGIYNRIYGTFVHPNIFAYYLTLPIALILFIILKAKLRIVTPFTYALFLPFYVLLLTLTFTRGAWLAFLIIIFLIGIIKYRPVLIASFILLLFTYILVPPIQDRIINLLYSPYSSVTWRFELWEDAVAYVFERPITGHGTGTANELILRRRGYQFGSSDAHNDYLKIALENGLLGLGAYLILLASLFNTLIKKYRREVNDQLKTFFFIMLCFSTSLYILSAADNVLRNTPLQWPLWALFGALFAVSYKHVPGTESRSSGTRSHPRVNVH